MVNTLDNDFDNEKLALRLTTNVKRQVFSFSPRHTIPVPGQDYCNVVDMVNHRENLTSGRVENYFGSCDFCIELWVQETADC